MNCRQAREMLSAYCDLKNEQADTTELEIHLAACADCRQSLDQYNLLGQRMRTLPRIEVVPGSYTRLMHALAKEHALHLQRDTASAPAKPVPKFLIPYLQQPLKKNALTAFSTAETGPLPVITQARNKRRRHPRPFTQFGVIGLAAAFLMLLMTGGLTSILILAGGKPVSIQPASINIQQSQITPNLYNTDTLYSHIVSGIADSDSVYYTAYDNKANWMLEKLDTKQQGQKQKSTPLLPAASNSPLIVLGSTNNWVIWLQLDTPKVIATKKSHDHASSDHTVRAWSLYALSLNTTAALQATTPHILLNGIFDESTAPDWTHTPIQGIWFLKNTLLITSIDTKGISHLDQYNLETSTDTLLASTSIDSHIFSSPTANSEGTDIYWTEEWQTDENLLHGDIWTQQIRPASPGYGRWQAHAEAHISLFRDDETSFRPQVINNTLFLISTNASTNSAINIRDDRQPLPGPTATENVLATPTATESVTAQSITPEVDPKIYGPQTDTALEGRVLAFKLGDYSPLLLPPELSDKIATLQGGTRFLLYQNSNGNVGLYDTLLGQALTVVSTVKNAAFLAVNNETAVWITNQPSDGTSTQTGTTIGNVQINMFTLTIKRISKVITK